MATSLYSRLYKYANPGNHAPRENYLTEAFAHLLERLFKHDPDRANALLFELLLADFRRTTDVEADNAVQALHQCLANGAARCETQERNSDTATTNQPDINIYDVTGMLSVSIEAKIGARLSDQLQRYGSYLASKNPQGALVFLTGVTPPPTDFLEPNHGAYGVGLRSVCSWTSVHDWMDATKDSVEDPFTAGLIAEFVRFLEEQELSHMNARDVESLGAYLSNQLQRKITPFMREVRSQVKLVLPDASYDFRNSNDWFAYSNGNYLWDWCYLSDRPGWYMAWGFAAAGNDGAWGRHLPASTQAIIVIGCDRPDEPRLPLDHLSNQERQQWEDWDLAQDGDVAGIRYTDAGQLAASPQGLVASLIFWMNPLLQEADAILRRCDEILEQAGD